MEHYELESTEENLLKTLEENIIDRNKDIVYFYNILEAQKTSTAIALDGRWGCGKTFFVKQTKLAITALNTSSNMNNEIREKIIQALPFHKKEETENFSVAVYYDAWENDNDTDPVLSILYEIIKQLSLDFSLQEIRIAKLGASISEAIIGRNVKGIIDALSSGDPLTKFKEQKDIEKKIKEFFGEILVERGNRLVVFIDELDRCRPSFAIRLLERIKHYIQDERITFVFSVNLEQLQHTVQHYYGNNFDACRYLDRFFNLRISLPPANMNKMYGQMGLDSNRWGDIFSRQTIKMFHFGLRETARFYSQVKAAVHDPTHNSRKYNFSFSDGEGIQIILMTIVPLLIGLKIANVSLYDEFINGKNVEPLKELFDADVDNRILERFLGVDESFVPNKEKILVKRDDVIVKFYNAVFIKQYSGKDYCTHLGRYEFTEESKKIALKVSSMMSNYAELN